MFQGYIVSCKKHIDDECYSGYSYIMTDTKNSTNKKISIKAIFLGAFGLLASMVIMGVVVFMNNASLQPKHDFLFFDDYRAMHNQYYVDEQGKIAKSEDYYNVTPGSDDYIYEEYIGPDMDIHYQAQDVPIFRYHINDGTVSQLSFEDAQELTLSSLDVAPDGVKFYSVYDASQAPVGFLANTGIESAQIVFSKGMARKTITMPSNEYSQGPYYFNFIGWVVSNDSELET
jgi:hypothetical protein